MKQNSMGPERSDGFGMIEVLIALFVFAVGMLGMAGLQIISKQNNFESSQRVIATNLAYDILERMRSNPAMLLEYAGDASTSKGPLGDGSLGGAAAPPSPNCAATNCDPFQLSQYDLWEWEAMIDGASEVATADGSNRGGLVLPSADIPAGVTDRSGVYSVAIVWRGKSKLTNPAGDGTAVWQCGEGTARYDGDMGEADVHRRIVVVTTYITTNG
jgi:type IV pilus assembly protein PilV